MRFAGILLAVFLLQALSSPVHADTQSLHVVFGNRKFTIPAFVHDGVLFASLNEFSSNVGLPLYENAESEKIEVRVGDHRLKFSAKNPFVVVLAHRENTISEVYQLPVEVTRTQSAYYLPLASVLPLLSRTWGKSLLLDQGKGEMVITVTSSPTARVTGVPTGSETAASVTETREDSGTDTVTSAGSADLAPREIAVEKVSTYDVGRISVDTRKNGTLIRIHSRKQIKTFDSELKNGSLVVTLTGATVDVNELRQTPTDGEGITGVEAEQLGGSARISFKLNSSFTSDKISRDVNTGDLLVSLFRKVDVSKVLNADKSARQDGDRSKWKLDCIVIDAGHGGKDPGAIGVSGIKEKNVTLGVSLKLGKLIERNMPGVKVIYTRKDDTFIPLDKRGQIANAAEGKLFISIHCNSTEAKPSNARGFEVYILRPGRTAEAIRIAEFENSVIKLEKDYESRYAKLDNESFILINMAHSAYAKYSERFAELLHDGVKASKKIGSKGVKQAGFYVLVGASMPGVLIESGFLSNSREEKYLASNDGQEHLAQLFFDAIETYAGEYEKSLKE